MMPWDLDLSYEWGDHYDPLIWEHFYYALSYEECSIAYKNRAREILHLLFNGEQADLLIDEIASIIGTLYDGRRFIEANQSMWEYHPETHKPGQYYDNNEFFDQPDNPKDWPNMVEYYKKYLTTTGMSDFLSGSFGVHALVDEADDSAIPDTPSITYIGTPGYPLNDLTFQTTAFSDPNGSATFAAIKWRIAEVTDDSNPIYLPGDRGIYEINPVWESDEITNDSNTTITIPASVVEPDHTYRVRCRMKDDSQRYSHWSDYIEFILL